MRLKFLVLCIAVLAMGCLPYWVSKPYDYVRPSHEGFYLPSHQVGPYHVQLILASEFAASMDSQLVGGCFESYLLDTAIEQYYAGLQIRVDSFWLIVNLEETLSVPLQRHPATLEPGERGLLMGPHADIAPVVLPANISSLISGFTVRVVFDTAARRDTIYYFTDDLRGGINGSGPWTTWERYQSPFSPSNSINYAIPGNDSVFVTILLYNVLGKVVDTVVSEYQQPGTYEKYLEDSLFSSLSSGIYFYQLKAGSFTKTRKLMLLK